MKENKYIVLARHLATRANAEGVVMGRKLDLPIELNSTVEQEYKNHMSSLRQLLRMGSKQVLFYSSPALRCKQTLELVMPVLVDDAHEYGVDERLQETDCGDFSGKTGEKLREDYPDLVDTWMWRPGEMIFPGGESYMQVQARAWLWLDEVLRGSEDVTFAVTHVDVIKMLLFKVLGVSISNKRLVDIGTGSVTIFSQRGEGVVVEALNLFGKLR